IDTYCISMTEEPSHVLEVLFLADQADVVDLPEYAGLDIVPLLETESALSNAREIMSVLFENDAYGAAIEARDRVQEIMLGYSDSNKENGFLAANWKLDRAQRKLNRITADHDVTLRLFHGRGGSISRGGGPMNKALLALPTETVTGEVKFTQQGEAISETYGNPAVAQRELEQMLNAQIRARYDALATSDRSVPTEWVAAMDAMADEAQTAYRDFRTTDGFVSFFEQMTPIDIIERLNLGSRPASRSDDRDLESLRAIPWVFAWTQTRAIVPGWFGLGSGIDAFVDDDADLEILREMYEEWPFFRTTLDNAALSLARTDLDIAERYASTVDAQLRERFFPRIRDEYRRSSEHVLAITGRDDLVDRPWLRTMLDRRNPYADPLNHLQASLMEETDLSERADRTLRLAVRGIAAGMKDTG
ncbi:MAG: phosphoenolpyruvate carboxylase, partial [Halanaeroarchaeum sp.]